MSTHAENDRIAESVCPHCAETMKANQGLGAALAYCYRKYPELRKEAPAYVRHDYPELFDGPGEAT